MPWSLPRARRVLPWDVCGFLSFLSSLFYDTCLCPKTCFLDSCAASCCAEERASTSVLCTRTPLCRGSQPRVLAPTWLSGTWLWHTLSAVWLPAFGATQSFAGANGPAYGAAWTRLSHLCLPQRNGVGFPLGPTRRASAQLLGLRPTLSVLTGAPLAPLRASSEDIRGFSFPD